MAKYENSKPDWAPKDDNAAFACRVMSGIEGIRDTTVGNINPALAAGRLKTKHKLVLGVEDYVKGVREGSRMVLSRAITLIESNNPAHFPKAQRVLQELLPYTGRALRIGITGVPGAGKSTIIEAFGNMSFGTTFRKSRQATIQASVAEIQKAHPDTKVITAFTSHIIIDRIQKKEGIRIPTPEEALQQLKAAGYTRVALTSLDVIPGMKLGDKWDFVPGVRMDHHNMFGTHWTPKAALNYQADSKTQVYASWGRVFKAPTADDLYYNNVGSMVREERDKYRALLASCAFHLLLLVLLSFTGIFAIVTAAEEKPPLDVTIYEETAGQQSGGGGGAAASPQAEAFAPGDIAAVSEKAALPAIHGLGKGPGICEEYPGLYGL